MSDKKQILVGFKISDLEKDSFETVAAKYGMRPGMLAGVLYRKFVEAYQQYGDAIQYPPRFDINIAQTDVEAKLDVANESKKQMAG